VKHYTSLRSAIFFVVSLTRIFAFCRHFYPSSVSLQLAGNLANNCNTYRQDDGTFVGPCSHTGGRASTTPRSTGIDILWCGHRRTHLRVCSCTLVEATTQPTADTKHYHRTNVRNMAGPSDKTSLRTEGVRHRCYTRTRCNCDRLLRRKHRRFVLGNQLATHEPHYNLRKQTWMVSPSNRPSLKYHN
jgi:hypothetical protein